MRHLHPRVFWVRTMARHRTTGAGSGAGRTQLIYATAIHLPQTLCRQRLAGDIGRRPRGERSEFGSQTVARLANRPELRGFLSSEATLDLPRDGPPKMEALPAPRATRFLLLQKGQLMCSDLTMLIAQTLNHGLHAHTV